MKSHEIVKYFKQVYKGGIKLCEINVAQFDPILISHPSNIKLPARRPGVTAVINNVNTSRCLLNLQKTPLGLQV